MRWWRRVAMAVLAAATAGRAPAAAPGFTPDIAWFHAPPGLVTGEISAVAVDRHDHVWVLHRPNTVAAADRARAAPPVLEYAADGRYLRGFGGPGPGYDWPVTEHSIAVDGRGHVWISGSFRADPARADDAVLEFAGDGRFVRQIGRKGASRGDLDTANVRAAADIFVDDAAHEVYVADGYVNRRVIVFDGRTGAFRRMWSAFGAPPPPEPAPPFRAADVPFAPETGDGPPGFNGVHAVEIARDGNVYVSDRNNQRIQVFDRAGHYRAQVFVDRNLPSAQTASGIALSPDRAQRYLYVADWGNGRVLVYDRATLALLASLGGKGTAAGRFLGPHLLATDSKGVLYVAEVQGRRVQRLVPDAPPGR